MAILGATLCAVVMVTVVTSKPICLNEGEDSSKSSESSESNSSEEAGAHFGPSEEPEQLETVTPNAMETNPPDTTQPPSADATPSPAMPNMSLLPNSDDPQTSTDTDAWEEAPGDTSQTVLGVDISQDMPESDPAQDSLNADTLHLLPDTEASLQPALTETDLIIATNQPQVTTAYQGVPRGATPPFLPHVIKPTPISFSKATPLSVPIGTALTGVPVCFTLQFATPEPSPPRGDSI